MSSTGENQRVLLFQDGTTEVNAGAVRWILHSLSLKRGDELTLLAVLHQASSLSTAFSVADRKPSGYKSRVVSHSMLGVNQEAILDRETKMEKKQDENNSETLQIYKLYEMHEVQVQIAIEVVSSGSSPKVVALGASKTLRATWVILDRHMKKYKAFFIDRLSCGISIMKSNDGIELLRGPTLKSISNNSSLLSYDEMLPGMPDEDDLFSIEISPAGFEKKQTVVPSSYATAENLHAAHAKNAEAIAQGREGVKAMTFSYQGCGIQIDQLSEDQNLPDGSIVQNLMNSLKAKNQFYQSLCSTCKSPKTGWLRDFTYAELQAATDGFSTQNCISEGGSGSVFMGIIGNKLNVAIKKLNTANCRREKEFESEIHALPIAIQKNVIMLLGCCWEGNHRLLVYEFACNGSLHQHLSKGSSTLTWTDRMKVALGTSRGLNYLHQHNIIHGNIRSGCILLNHEYEPMIGNFGVAQAYEEEKLQENKISDVGKLSLKADVHSFGVILLELVSGRAINNDESAQKSLVRWAKPLLKERKYQELIDPALVNSSGSHQLGWMVQVAEECLCRHPEKRLSMDKVLLALENLVVEKKEAGFMHEDYLPRTPYSMSRAPGSSKSASQDGEESMAKRVTQDAEQCETTSNSKSDVSVRSTSINFSKLFSGGFRNKKVVKARSYGRPLISYDEMLN